MDVYLIPVGSDRYELYCEEADDVTDVAAEPPAGLFKSVVHRFRLALARVERERRQGTFVAASNKADGRWTRRVKDRLLRWTAEKIAEQRLLWHLRRQPDATAIFPGDLSAAQAMTIIRRMLQRDAERHRWWLIFNTVAFSVAAVLVFLPGPNLVAYYFAFRLVGHYLSMRGAQHGLNHVRWSERPSTLLAELRRAITLAAPERERHVSDIASKLHLPHLANFFKRTVIPSA